MVCLPCEQLGAQCAPTLTGPGFWQASVKAWYRQPSGYNSWKPSRVLWYSASISDSFEATGPDSAARAGVAGAQQLYRAKGLLKLLLHGACASTEREARVGIPTTGCEVGLIRREAAAQQAHSQRHLCTAPSSQGIRNSLCFSSSRFLC